MKTSAQKKKSTPEIIAAIQALDLAPIKFKLMDAEEGHGWTRAQADHLEVEYKRFLILLTKYPKASIAPSKSVDKFWHGHILDTLKYAEDCNTTFGYFLHHFPYFGMRGADDAANLAAAAVTMQKLYQQEFGSEQAPTVSFCGATTSGKQTAQLQDVAFCGASEVSFCGATNSVSFCGATNSVSFCGATSSDELQAASKDTAFCGAPSDISFCGATNGVSFCGATNNVSFCGATSSDKLSATEGSSFCGADTSASADDILNTSTRPGLPVR